MASIQQDKKGNYLISYKLNGKWKSKYVGSKDKYKKSEVEKIRLELESIEVNQKFNIVIREDKKTINDLIEAYKKYVFSRQGGKPLTINTRRSYGDRILKLSAWLQSKNLKKLDDLTDDMAFDFTVDCQNMFNDMKLSSVKLLQQTFIRFLKWSNNRGYFRNSALISEITRLPEGDKVERYFSEDELKVFFNHKLLCDAYKMMFFTGMRVSEVCDLTWNDYNADTNMISFWAKNQKVNRIELNSKAKEVLLGQIGKHSKYCFTNKQGKKLKPNSVRHTMIAYANKHDIKDAYPHIFRHSFASYLAIKNVPIQKIQKLMRHANIRETMRYAHLSTGSLIEASNKICELNL